VHSGRHVLLNKAKASTHFHKNGSSGLLREPKVSRKSGALIKLIFKGISKSELIINSWGFGVLGSNT